MLSTTTITVGGQQLHADPDVQEHARAGVMQSQLHSAQRDPWLFSETKGNAWWGELGLFPGCGRNQRKEKS